MSTGNRWRPWWDRWYTPYLALLLLPVITYPICTVILRSIPSCILDEDNYRAGDIAWVLAPTALDLLPFAWLPSRNSRVRWSAAIAGLIGAARFAIPMALPINDAFSDEEMTLPPCEGYEIHLFWVLGMIFLLPVLWAISAVLAGVAAFFTRPRSGTRSAA